MTSHENDLYTPEWTKAFCAYSKARVPSYHKQFLNVQKE